MNMKIRTMEDLYKFYYGDITNIQKADADLLTTTTGAHSSKYGPYAWAQVNNVPNLFNILPKEAYTQTGYKAMTAYPSYTAGVSEGGAIPDTIKPTYANVQAKPKEVVAPFSVSTKQSSLSKAGVDDVIDPEQLRRNMADFHKKDMNVMLNTSNGTLATNKLESIDRVVGSYAEITNAAQADNNAYTAGDLDIYGQDRDAAASWTDSYVSYATSDRTLTLDLIRTVVKGVKSYGAKPTYILTGTDTAQAIDNLVDMYYRTSGANIGGKTHLSANGIQEPGKEGNVETATLFGIPIVEDANVVSETGGISRIYVLDTSVEGGKPILSLGITTPTLHIVSPSTFSVNKLSNEEYYYTSGELVCRNFRRQGKVRDLSA